MPDKQHPKNAFFGGVATKGFLPPISAVEMPPIARVLAPPMWELIGARLARGCGLAGTLLVALGGLPIGIQSRRSILPARGEAWRCTPRRLLA